MIRVLFWQRITRMKHRLVHMDVGAALRLTLLVALGTYVLVDGLSRLWVDRPLTIVNDAARRADLLASSIRLSVLLGAVISFDSFGDLWRSREHEILGSLPLPPGDIYIYRLASVSVRGLPFLSIVMLVWSRVFLAGETGVFLDGTVIIALGFMGAIVWGLYWHLVAGAAVAAPDDGPMKSMAAGGVTTPERALLLYSPMFALASSFAMSFVGLIALDAYRDGSDLGLGVAGLSFGGAVLGFIKGRSQFRANYYLALSALADGEALDGAFTETAPGPDYFGSFMVDRLPDSIRVFVQRDLRQSFRQNRLVPWALLGLSVLMIFLFERLGEWGPAAVSVLLLGASAESFRLAKAGADAPWFWLTLPARMRTLYLGRLVSVLFFPLLVFPGVAYALWGADYGVLSFIVPLSMGVGLGFLGLNLSTLDLGQGRWTLWIHLLVGGTVVALAAPGFAEGNGGLPMAAAAALSLGAVSMVLLKGLAERLATLEMAR